MYPSDENALATRLMKGYSVTAQMMNRNVVLA
jgi:hypothetical protein